jgi:hypothetical protein
MTKIARLVPKFVEFAPPELKEGVLYVSMVYGSAIHKCCCGCGEKVVTPFSPTDWKMTFDGESVSLHPSIGNWSFRCRSHYWIRENEIHWAPQWWQDEIDAGRVRDRNAKSRYFGLRWKSQSQAAEMDAGHGHRQSPPGVWNRIKSRVASAVRALLPNR